ncbi:unnamed protein product [Ambrosiozyma monospora]|uniref:Unnamed protein product n=1 Tax=Ambrosiozyma monospora TaxID=43982 RepID=A0ACB5U9B0_AMBMO|nr:unnamed protein product [Ambrosiozyma monospora]
MISSIIPITRPILKSTTTLFTQASKRTIVQGRFKPFAQKPKPNPQRAQRATQSKAIAKLVRESLEKDEPNFTQGAKKIYFPSATITLLRPNAKHTPNQAKFIVPKSFNKLDLRDYLFNIYGLRVSYISSTLMPARFTRSLPQPYRPRFRSPQIKKMTVDLLEPFVWPAETTAFKEELELVKQLKIYEFRAFEVEEKDEKY